MSKQKLKLIVGVLIFILCVGAYYIYESRHKSIVIQQDQNTDPFIGQPIYVVPPVTKVYNNDTYKFSLKYPEDFSVRTLSVDGVETIILENQKSEGVQIAISKFDNGETKNLSQEMIRESLPDLVITDVQNVEVGMEHKGVAFKSDNKDFSGRSREVWFVFKGNLYQISTYDRFDDLLKEIFATWQFKS